MTVPNASPPQGSQPPGRIVLANRPEPLPEPPRPAAERLREGLEEALFQGRRFAVETWEDFRRQDRWFRWKVAIVAAWTVVSLFAIRVAMSGPDDPSANGLGAYVSVTHTTMSWGLLVHNRSDEPWTHVRVELEDGWIHERANIGPDEKVVLSPAQFTRGKQQAPLEMEIRSVRIETDEGDASPPVVR